MLSPLPWSDDDAAAAAAAEEEAEDWEVVDEAASEVVDAASEVVDAAPEVVDAAVVDVSKVERELVRDDEVDEVEELRVLVVFVP